MNTKNVVKFLKELDFSGESIVEIIDNMKENKTDFYSSDDNYRFILKSEIDKIQQDELESDLYILGCFNAWFLSNVLEIDQDAIESLQNSNAYEAIGKLIVSMNKIEELQEEYSSTDGYGHHFAHYDHYELEIEDYYVFRVN